MEKSSFFNAILDGNGTPDRAYMAEDFAKFFSTFIGNGVFPNPSSNLQVVAINNNMDITINTGMAWINGYMYQNTTNLTKSIVNADGVLNRKDLVVLQLNFINREIKVIVKQGTFSSNPTVPTLERNADVWELGLAEINILRGSTKITQSNITDLRHNNNYCGIVTGLIEQVDVTTLFNQYSVALQEKEIKFEEQFNIWFESVKGLLDTDVAGRLTNEITKINTKLDNIDLSANKVLLNKITGLNSTNVQDGMSELFQSASNGKNNIANVVGSPLLATDTFLQQKNKIQELKNKFASNLNNKKIYLSNTDSLDKMINEVNNIFVRGYNTGVFTKKDCVWDSNNSFFYFEKKNSLNFRPSLVLIYPLYASDINYNSIEPEILYHRPIYIDGGKERYMYPQYYRMGNVGWMNDVSQMLYYGGFKIYVPYGYQENEFTFGWIAIE